MSEDKSAFGPWDLGFELDKAYDANIGFKLYDIPVPMQQLFERLEGADLAEFRSAGAAAEFDDENIYESIAVNYLGLLGWTVMPATHKGKIYKIGLTYKVDDEYVGYVLDKVSKHFTELFGKPKTKLLDRRQKVWQANGVRVRLTYRDFKVNDYAYQIHVIAKAIS